METDDQTTPLILLSGMGADERVFAPQKKAFPNLTIPPWIDPLPRESLTSYGKRMADAVDPGRPCFLGGASFGGMVAMEMRKHLDVKATLLIGSAQQPSDLPWPVAAIRPVAGLANWLPIEIFQFACRCLRFVAGRFLSAHANGIMVQVERSDSPFMRWAMFALLRWEETQDGVDVSSSPVFHIHGDRDRALPLKNVDATTIVRGGGHVISLTHATQVNEFLTHAMNVKDLLS